MTRERALDEIWGAAAVENVVDRYVASCGASSAGPPLIRTVRGVGFVLEP